MNAVIRMVGVLALIATGCAHEVTSGAGGYFPVHSEATLPTALVPGQLLAKAGCLVLSAEDGQALLLWPEDYRREGDTVIGPNGDVLATVGDQVRAGGGYVTEDVANNLIGADVKAGCGVDTYFVVSTVLGAGAK
jgi:hypothetical protein